MNLEFNNTARENKIKLFNQKVDMFKDQKGYNRLREDANKAILYSAFCGWSQIAASNFIEQITKASMTELQEYFNTEYVIAEEIGEIFPAYL